MKFFKKSSEGPKPVNEGKKSQLDSLKDKVDVLNKHKMSQLEGGKTESKPFSDFFNWNSSCGDTIPQ